MPKSCLQIIAPYLETMIELLRRSVRERREWSLQVICKKDGQCRVLIRSGEAAKVEKVVPEPDEYVLLDYHTHPFKHATKLSDTDLQTVALILRPKVVCTGNAKEGKIVCWWLKDLVDKAFLEVMDKSDYLKVLATTAVRKLCELLTKEEKEDLKKALQKNDLDKLFEYMEKYLPKEYRKIVEVADELDSLLDSIACAEVGVRL